MGGMHTWVWGVTYPEFMDVLVPMASQPTEMSGRNWMMRRMLIDAIRNDPDWKDGNYTTQPRALQVANVFFGIATNGGAQAYHKMAPTREKADKLLDDRLAAPFTADANDFLYQWESSRDYNPAPGLERIRGRAARHQLRRRRAQSAGARNHGARAQAHQERPPVPDPGQRRHARPRHHRNGEVLEAAVAGSAADCAPARNVGGTTGTASHDARQAGAVVGPLAHRFSELPLQPDRDAL